MSSRILHTAHDEQAHRRTRIFLEFAFFALSAIAAIALILSLSACGTKNPFKRGRDEPDLKATADTNTPTTDTSTTADTSTTTDTVVTNDEVTPTPVSFSSEVYPILVNDCKSCHNGGLGGYKVSGDPTGDYSSIVSKVDTADPANSILLQKASGLTNHGGGQFFDVGDDDYNTILDWITQGAKDN